MYFLKKSIAINGQIQFIIGHETRHFDMYLLLFIVTHVIKHV